MDEGTRLIKHYPKALFEVVHNGKAPTENEIGATKSK